LTLPRELTAKHPRHSFLFNAHADPPTATLQRIKALVTGSLPTFVDVGYNFGGASIAEDSVIQQLQRANKTVRLFPTRFTIRSQQTAFCRSRSWGMTLGSAFFQVPSTRR
jgi:predicted AlkP superfamily pyrophosphatase or phosphodiesterase